MKRRHYGAAATLHLIWHARRDQGLLTFTDTRPKTIRHLFLFIVIIFFAFLFHDLFIYKFV